MSAGPRHVEVTYCDDIRQEVGNKMSYMGIYGSDMHVSTAPVLLAKLCIVVKVITNVDDPFEALEIRISSVKGSEETEILATGPVPIVMPKTESDSRLYCAHYSFVLSPLQIDGDSSLRVTAKTEREEIRGAGLRIQVIPPQASPAENQPLG